MLKSFFLPCSVPAAALLKFFLYQGILGRSPLLECIQIVQKSSRYVEIEQGIGKRSGALKSRCKSVPIILYGRRWNSSRASCLEPEAALAWSAARLPRPGPGCCPTPVSCPTLFSRPSKT
ncbi:hypothetical protein P7K49_039293 [Saguinus oedipus]|uniref:Secreted protein n=1 Tax=Saguinus oedipus TaxID=9490 RepID=A0ABQ9TH36_SAGOE|nr:hypothetical protein P7K49_039293 [Saguinus oedipus]